MRGGLRLRLDLDASKGYKHRQSCDAVLVLRDFSIFTIFLKAVTMWDVVRC